MRCQGVRIAGRIAGPLLVGAGFAALALAERARPLRGRDTPDSPRRLARNLVLAGLSGAAVQVAERPFTLPLARFVARRRLGLLFALRLPSGVERAAALALMDYTLYLWHVMTHRVPFLWRFHRVHHADLDMDTTTAIRFHLGEFVLSAPYRAAPGQTHECADRVALTLASSKAAQRSDFVVLPKADSH